MKKLLLPLLVLLKLSSEAQITIDYQDLPLVGTKYFSKTNTTTIANVSAGVNGISQNWDFSSLPAQGNDTSIYLIPSQTPFDANFPGATHVKSGIIPEGKIYYYFKATASSIEIIGAGLISSEFTGSPAIPLKASSPLQYVRLPFTYGYTNTSQTTFTGKVSAATLGINIPLIDSVKIEISLVKKDTANASGIIKTPLKEYDALRLTSHTTTSLHYYYKQFIWQTADALFPPTTTSVVEKFWWAKNIGTEVFKIEYEDAAGKTPLVVSWFDDKQILGFHTGNNELAGSVLYPNPASATATIIPSFSREYEATLYSGEGEVLYKKSLLTGSHSITTAEFPAGIYMLQLKSENGLSTTKKLIIQK